MSIRQNKTANTLSVLESVSKEKLTLGKFLWSIRMSDELSQVDFAEILGVSRQYLCDLEHGRRYPSPKMAAAFANKLDYSEQQFLRLCLQDLVDRDGLHVHIEVKAA